MKKIKKSFRSATALLLALMTLSAAVCGCSDQTSGSDTSAHPDTTPGTPADSSAPDTAAGDSSADESGSADTSAHPDTTPGTPADSSAPDTAAGDSSADESGSADTSAHPDTTPGTPADSSAPDTAAGDSSADGSGSADTSAPETTSVEGAEVPFGSYKILFIGNSFTYYNDMPMMFQKLANAAGYNLTVSSITKGGYYLHQMNDVNDQYGKQVNTYLSKNKYDYVIIQEQSAQPAKNPADFYTAARSLVKKIRDNGAVPILYETWGYKTGHSGLASYGGTHESMEYRLWGPTEALGKELDVAVSYAGVAYLDVFTNHKEINLYSDDLKHPSSLGSYLIACVHYATIFHRSPIGLKNTTAASDKIAGILQQAAYDAVFNTPALPEKYKKTSEGVGSLPSDTTAVETAPVNPADLPFVSGKGTSEYGIDGSKMKNLTALPSSDIISVIDISKAACAGINGTKGKNCSDATGTTLTEAQLADLADIGYGVSLIGAVTMPSTAKNGTTFTGLGALCNGHWGTSWMANWQFGTQKYDINGNKTADGKYFGLITLNFGKKCDFDAIGFFSGSLQGFPQVAEIYVSDDGKNWTLVPSACWDACAMSKAGQTLESVGSTSPIDPWNGNTAKVSCFFSMAGTGGQYIRLGVVIGKGDPAVLTPAAVQDINTRELAVYGKIQ